MADIRLAKPAAGASESVQCAPEARFVFDFPTTDATLARDGDNLNIRFEDGSNLELQGFYQQYNEENLPSFNIDGTEVAAADFFAAMNEPDLMPAAGPGTGTVANGARFHEWGDSALTGGIQHLNGLDWGFSRSFEWDDVPNAVGRNGDDWGWWAGRDSGASNNPVTLTPENPGVVPPDTPDIPVVGVTPGSVDPTAPSDLRVVSEADLRRGDAFVDGAMRVTAPDGVASIEIAGRAIWANGALLAPERIPTDEGYFHNFAYDAASGRLTYTFTLEKATQEHTQQGADSIAHSLPIVVRDVDGDSASGRLTIVVRDDVPEITVSQGQTATAVFGADDTLEGGSLRSLEVAFNGKEQEGRPEVNDANTVVWTKGDETLTNIDALAEGESAISGGLMVTRTGNDFTFSFVSEKPAEGTNYGLELKITDADGDVSWATLPMTVPSIKTPGDGGDEPGGEGSKDLYAATIRMDEGDNPEEHAEGESHAQNSGEGSFTVNLHGESGEILVGTKDAGYRITIADDGNHHIDTLGSGLAAIHGITVTLDTDAAETLSPGVDGNWTVNFSYARSEAQTHKTKDGTLLDKLEGNIPLTVWDASGDAATGNIHVELHDDLTVITDKGYAGKVEFDAPDNFTRTFTSNDFHYDDFNTAKSYWQQSGGGVLDTINTHPSHLQGDGTNVNFNMTASFVHYQYDVDKDGHLKVTNVVDISKSINNSGKAFAISEENGLSMDSGIARPWNQPNGEFSTGAQLTRANDELEDKDSLPATWRNDKGMTDQYNMMKDAYGEHFNEGALSAANVSEAVVFDLNDLAYGIELDLGSSFEKGDRVLVTFLTTAPYSDDNHIGKMKEFCYEDFFKDDGTPKEIDPSLGVERISHTDPESGEISYSYRIEVADGFTKAFVSAVGSSTYEDQDGTGLNVKLADGESETSGFAIKGVEFLTPQWTQTGTVAATSADEPIEYGWDFSGFPKTVEVQGYHAGTYGLVIDQVRDDEGKEVAGSWKAVMNAPDEKGYHGQELFTFSIDTTTGKWVYTQLHEFTAKGDDGSSYDPDFTITATDADGDVATLSLPLNWEFVRFDEVRQGYYDKNWGTDPSKDTADDVLLGADGASLLFGKGGDDLVLGDRFGSGEDSDDTAVQAIIKTISDQQKDSHQDHTGNTLTDKLHAKLGGLSHDQLGELASALEDHEAAGGDDLIYGGVGNDILLGMKGADTLYGEKGNDYIFGGTGNDVLVGGVGGLEGAPAINANFAFLVDVSTGNDVEAAKEQLALLFHQMQDKYAGTDANVNILLMGFHSYATETVSVNLFETENALGKLMKGLEEIDNKPKTLTGADYTQKNDGGQYVDDPDKEELNALSQSGSNHELAFNYAEGWFKQVGGAASANQTFLLSSREANAHIYRDGTPNENFFYPNGAGVGLMSLADLAKKCDGVEYDPKIGLKFTKFELGTEFPIKDSAGKIYADVTADGLLVTHDKWFFKGSTVRKGEGEPLVETNNLNDGMNATNKPLALYFNGDNWVLAAVTGMVVSDNDGNKIFGEDEVHKNTVTPEHSKDAFGSLQGHSDVTLVDAPEGMYGVDNPADLDAAQMLGSVSHAAHGDTLLGGDGDDILFGDSMPDTLAGLDTKDISAAVRADPQKYAGDVDGGKGDNDYLDGGEGNDILYGGAGNDELHGGEHDDILYGGSGNDSLYGDAGNDYLHGGDGTDYLFGGEGNDLIVYDPTDYLIDGGADIDFLLVGDGVDANLGDLLTGQNDTIVHNVEVLLKGADAMSLTNIPDLEEYGITMGKDGKSLTLSDSWTTDGDGETYGEGADAFTVTTWKNGDLTLETTLTDENNNHVLQAATNELNNAQG